MQGLKSRHPDLCNSWHAGPSPIRNRSRLLRYPARTLPGWICTLCGLIEPQVRHLASWDQNPKGKGPPCERRLHAHLRHRLFFNPISSLLPGGARTLCHSLRPQMNIPGHCWLAVLSMWAIGWSRKRPLVWPRLWQAWQRYRTGPGRGHTWLLIPFPLYRWWVKA